MASRDEIDRLQRFLDDQDRSIVSFHAGSPLIPRGNPLAVLADQVHRLGVSIETEAWIPSADSEYDISSAGNRTSSVIADEDHYQKPSDFMHISNRAGYTASSAVYRAPSTRSSDASSLAPSIFTYASVGTSAGVSSQPPPRPHIRSFVQVLTAGAPDDHTAVTNAPPLVPAPASHPLWCELCVTKNCSAIFRIDQTREWIDHHCRHLRDRYPSQLVCWFCDHVPFVATGQTKGERYANFLDRMEHIREHISDEDRTMDHMRPDFSMINHLADNHIIDEGMRRICLKYSEVPDALRLPDSSASGSTQANQAARRPPGPGLAHDLDREKRLQRRVGRHPQRAPMPIANV
ncbi:hypothetical protein BR93DRAFT_968543 [Coniochaeta sp. PMI_546]|nr:hypothetical protein BR93DRAFT_968543 [Coniochaeta sp. PMI_546]